MPIAPQVASRGPEAPSEAYLGTPWVWPSVWTDNEDIQNPHLIRPGDHIWITSGEMRIVSRNEADSMIATIEDDVFVSETVSVYEPHTHTHDKKCLRTAQTSR